MENGMMSKYPKSKVVALEDARKTRDRTYEDSLSDQTGIRKIGALRSVRKFDIWPRITAPERDDLLIDDFLKGVEIVSQLRGTRALSPACVHEYSILFIGGPEKVTDVEYQMHSEGLEFATVEDLFGLAELENRDVFSLGPSIYAFGTRIQDKKGGYFSPTLVHNPMNVRVRLCMMRAEYVQPTDVMLVRMRYA